MVPVFKFLATLSSKVRTKEDNIRPGISEAKDCSEAGSKLAGIETELLASREYSCNIKWYVVRQDDGTSIYKLQNDLDRCNITVRHVEFECKVLLCTVVGLLECGA